MMIRPATLHDISAVKQLESVFHHDRISHRSIRRFILAQRVYLLLADDKPAGYCILLPRKHSPALRIYSIAVAPAHHGKGYARALLRFAETLGYSALHLEVNTKNSAALALYRSFGFQELRTVSGYYDNGDDAIKMRKVISTQ